MLDFTEINLTSTIRDLDYTRRAVQHMNGVIESVDFEDMDAQMILEYLTKNMILISFKDQLKRYIYRVAELDGPFSEIGDKEYLGIISDAFKYNMAPASFTPTSRSKAAIYKSFLKVNAVKRSTIFVLGFGQWQSDDKEWKPGENVTVSFERAVSQPKGDPSENRLYPVEEEEGGTF